jgi:hypothetical protein
LAPAPVDGMGIAENAQKQPAAARLKNRLFRVLKRACKNG